MVCSDELLPLQAGIRTLQGDGRQAINYAGWPPGQRVGALGSRSPAELMTIRAGCRPALAIRMVYTAFLIY